MSPSVPPAVHDAARLAAVRATGLLDTPADEPFDRLARLAGTVLEAPLAFVTIVDDRRSFWKACIGVPATDPAERQNPVEESFCQYVIGTSEPLIVGDARSDPRTRDNPAIELMGAAAWAGFPVRSPDGQVLGTFCVVDTVRREWTPRQVDVLETLAHAASGEVALRLSVEAERSARASATAAAERLAHQTALLRSATESTPDGICAFSRGGQLLNVNTRFIEMFALPAELSTDMRIESLVEAVRGHVCDPEALTRLVPQLAADAPTSARVELALRDGRVLDAYASRLCSDGADYGWAWYMRDVTAERRAADELLESGERFAALARTLQDSLLPPHLPDVPGLEVAARYLPAAGGADVLGDFYDVFQSGRSRWGVVMGDVCGKGVEAAKVTALARYTIRAAAIRGLSPRRILSTLNRAVLAQQDSDERFLTAVYVTLRQRHGAVSATLCSAGHTLSLLRRAGGVEAVGGPGMVLGVFDAPDLSDTRLDLVPGDTLVLYTDGLTEARRAGEMFGEERLRALLAHLDGLDAATTARAIEEAVIEFAGHPPADDTAIMVLRVASPQP